MSEYKHVGKLTPRFEGMSLALGKPVYMEDMLPEDVWYIQAIHCPYASAVVESIDSKVAQKVPEFVHLFTWEDCTEMTNFGWPYCAYERKVLNREARFEGEVVALVVAESLAAAEKAAKMVKIKWDVKEPLMDFTKSLKGDIIVHGDHLDEIKYDHLWDKTYNPSINQVTRSFRDYGDMEAARNKCAHITKVHAYTPQQIHTQMESPRSYSYFDERGFLIVKAPTQSVHAMQEDVARSLGIDRRKVRVIKTQVGGGFGGRNMFAPYVYAALVTYKTGHAATIIYDREMAMVAVDTRHEYVLDAELGADENGIFRFIDVEATQNAGAYSEESEDVLQTGIKNSYALFPRLDAMRILEYSVFTNKVEGYAFRGFGATQNCFLLNVAARHIADEMNMDLPTVLKKNIGKVGDSHPVMNGWEEDSPTYITSTKLEECIDRSMEIINWSDRRNKSLPEGNIVTGCGLGVAAHASGVPLVDRGNVNITMNSDGAFSVYSGHSDIGTGSNTAMVQMVAEVLEVPMDHVHLMAADTAFTPFDAGTYASSNVYRAGGAAVIAAKKMKQLLYEAVREVAGLPADTPLVFEDEVFYLENGKRLMDLIEFADKRDFYTGGDPLVVSGSFPDKFAPSPYVATTAFVEVDKETGYYRVLEMANVVDCGQVINPSNARVQVMGGVTQSLGMTMFEEVNYTKDRHRMVNRTLQSYKIPCQMDMPRMTVEFVDDKEPSGPFGAKSLGEIATGSPAPAITDALFNALGIHFDSLPITPEKVLRAIKEKEAGKEKK